MKAISLPVRMLLGMTQAAPYNLGTTNLAFYLPSN
jgi:hypothetical protein